MVKVRETFDNKQKGVKEMMTATLEKPVKNDFRIYGKQANAGRNDEITVELVLMSVKTFDVEDWGKIYLMPGGNIYKSRSKRSYGEEIIRTVRTPSGRTIEISELIPDYEVIEYVGDLNDVRDLTVYREDELKPSIELAFKKDSNGNEYKYTFKFGDVEKMLEIENLLTEAFGPGRVYHV